jgi:hypothetical protein
MTFLEQLQQTAGLLGQQVQNVNPFGNYNPTLASDFVNTPFGVPVAQNRFVGNQFQTPDLTGSTYTPGNFSLAPGAGFNFGNFGSYTPMPFNQGNVATTTTQPGLLAGVERAMGGGDGKENLERLLGNRPGVSTEVIGGRAFRFNPDGTVTQLDPNSLDAKLATTVNSLLDYTPMNVAKGLLGMGDDPNDIYERIENTYGTQTAQDFMQQNALAINKELQSDEYQKFKADLQAKATTPSGALRDDQVEQLNFQADLQGRKTRETKTDRGGLNKAREASKDRAAAATGKSRGFFGGR